MGPESDLPAACHHVLTVVGILPHQFDLLRAYFRNYGLNPELSPPDSRGSRGNWVYVHFDRDVESIPCIRPKINLADHLVVGCFIGFFQKEVCIPVPVPVQRVQDPISKFFKIPRMDEDLTALPMKEKSFWTKVREFIFGEKKIERKSGGFFGGLF
jgi:hypothetical protein